MVENVERVMQEEKLSPKEATIKSMGEITGALVGIATVLSAVFVPMAFFGGSVGIIYRQFSITIVTAMALSVVVALVLTPAPVSYTHLDVYKRQQHDHVAEPVAAGNALDGDRQPRDLILDEIHHAAHASGMAGGTFERDPDGERGGGFLLIHGVMFSDDCLLYTSRCV